MDPPYCCVQFQVVHSHGCVVWHVWTDHNLSILLWMDIRVIFSSGNNTAMDIPEHVFGEHIVARFWCAALKFGQRFSRKFPMGPLHQAKNQSLGQHRISSHGHKPNNPPTCEGGSGREGSCFQVIRIKFFASTGLDHTLFPPRSLLFLF